MPPIVLQGSSGHVLLMSPWGQRERPARGAAAGALRAAAGLEVPVGKDGLDCLPARLHRAAAR